MEHGGQKVGGGGRWMRTERERDGKLKLESVLAGHCISPFSFVLSSSSVSELVSSVLGQIFLFFLSLGSMVRVG